MKSKLKIKVRKKSAIVEKPAAVEEVETADQHTTALKSTVKGWVSEFHERIRKDTENARRQFDS